MSDKDEEDNVKASREKSRDNDQETEKSRRYKSRQRRSRHEDDTDTDDENSRTKKRKHHHRHRHRKRDKDSDDKSDEKRDRHRKQKRKHKHGKEKEKKRRKYDSSSSSDDSDHDSSSADHHRRDHAHRSHSHQRKKRRDGAPPSPTNHTPVFGQYGILKASDLHRKKQSFEVWLQEVKHINNFTGSKRELQTYFDEYREDYNTATLPHEKYYDYESWEMREYHKLMNNNKNSDTSAVAQTDQASHNERLKDRARQKEKIEQDLLLSTMNREKIQDMKRQADLKAQMQVAFKTGDRETYQRLKQKLEPDK